MAFSIGFLFSLAQPDETWLPGSSVSGYRMLLASLVVLGLLALWAWLMRRGVFTKRQQGAVTIETAVPLGERRSLVIVSIEGRRLLLGLTPASVSLVTNLEPGGAGFDTALDRAEHKTADAN